MASFSQSMSFYAADTLESEGAEVFHTFLNDSHGSADCQQSVHSHQHPMTHTTGGFSLGKGTSLPYNQHSWAIRNIGNGRKAGPWRTYFLTFILCLQEVGSKVGIRVKM